MSAYFAAVMKAEEGGFYATVPDLPGCITQGETLEELDAMLHEAASLWLDGETPPPARSHASVLKEASKEEDFLFLTLVTLPDVVVMERVNMRVPRVDLALIDAAASRRSLNRTAYMIMAAKKVARENANF